MAVRRALWELEEQATADADRRLPDSPVHVVWDPVVRDHLSKASS
jgi:hypothetical protein